MRNIFTMLTPNFTASQNITDPSILTLTDTSTGTDNTLTSRIVYIEQYNGEYLVEEGTTTDFEPWDIGDTTLELDVLDKDYAVLITVKWLAGSTIAYTKSVLYEFNAYARIYRYQLFRAQVTRPQFLDSPNYLNVFSALNVYIIGANEAVELGGDITNAQLANTKNKYLIDNPQLVF